MKKRQNLFMVMGAPSLFLIFAVLCMAILGLLTLGTSRTDLEMSKASLEQMSLYYEACREATDVCLELENALIEAGKKAADTQSGKKAAGVQAGKRSAEESAYFALAKAAAEKTEGAFWEEELCRIIFERKITEEQSLRVELEVTEPGSGSCLRLVSWKTVVSGTWEPELHQPVFKGV